MTGVRAQRKARMEEELRPAMRSSRKRSHADARDVEDREIFTRRLTDLAVRETGCEPSDVEITFVGDLSDAVIFIWDAKHEAARAYRAV